LARLTVGDFEYHELQLSKGAVVLDQKSGEPLLWDLEHVPLGKWVRTRPALVDVIFRTVLYALGVIVVLLLEKAFDGQHEYGGFSPSLRAVFHHVDIYHVWVNAICLSGALLGYNMLSVIRKYLGEGGLMRLFLSPLPEESWGKGEW